MVPAGIDGVAGVTASDCSTGARQVSAAPGLVTLPLWAVIIAEPEAATQVATPLDTPMVATAMVSELHCTGG